MKKRPVRIMKKRTSKQQQQKKAWMLQKRKDQKAWKSQNVRAKVRKAAKAGATYQPRQPRQATLQKLLILAPPPPLATEILTVGR